MLAALLQLPTGTWNRSREFVSDVSLTPTNVIGFGMVSVVADVCGRRGTHHSHVHLWLKISTLVILCQNVKLFGRMPRANILQGPQLDIF